MFRAVQDAQHRLHLRGAQAGVHCLRAVDGHRAVLGAMDEQHAGPVVRDEELREDGMLGGGKGFREARVELCVLRVLLSRGEERAQRVAERGRVRPSPVVQVGAELQPQPRELHARVRREPRRGGVGAVVRERGLRDWGLRGACRVQECGELRWVQYLVALVERRGLWHEEVRALQRSRMRRCGQLRSVARSALLTCGLGTEEHSRRRPRPGRRGIAPREAAGLRE